MEGHNASGLPRWESSSMRQDTKFVFISGLALEVYFYLFDPGVYFLSGPIVLAATIALILILGIRSKMSKRPRTGPG